MLLKMENMFLSTHNHMSNKLSQLHNLFNKFKPSQLHSTFTLIKVNLLLSQFNQWQFQPVHSMLKLLLNSNCTRCLTNCKAHRCLNQILSLCLILAAFRRKRPDLRDWCKVSKPHKLNTPISYSLKDQWLSKMNLKSLIKQWNWEIWLNKNVPNIQNHSKNWKQHSTKILPTLC